MIDRLKRNWLVVVLVLAVGYLVMKDYVGVRQYASYGASIGGMGGQAMPMEAKLDMGVSSGFVGEAAPIAQMERMVVQDTDMSLLVKDVMVVIDSVEKTVVDLGGYMVSKNINRPEEAATGYITVRVPIEKRENALELFRKMGVRVVSENVYGRDVTDQYVDIDERIRTLEKTKAKMQSILDQATKVQDLMSIQVQLNQIQQQIDALKGQQKYLEQTAKLTRITVNLSTDELALPYAPDTAWRPGVVFKTAVRALVQATRSVVNALIWLMVFIPLLVVVVFAGWLIKKIWVRFPRKL